ncbi:DUF1772 domain-containing protein [Nonomuraea sp. MG754425]|uniref:DUF1772 domain-containing protein n=1 Tax=Nonomuraea sp. MG754425 TaxID=2570319 RepID=UPI001F28CB8A|nr:DUF1772 domain-containing protein [Nonomuraea sp. MG754425]MCF6471493.1 DUF1772 domain-containing protein [Nonomuraea sp. MG754425]
MSVALVASRTVALLLVILTLAGLEPLNRIADAWDPDRLPADWQRSRRRWFDLHLVRAALALVAFVCLIAAQALDQGGPERPADQPSRAWPSHALPEFGKGRPHGTFRTVRTRPGRDPARRLRVIA